MAAHIVLDARKLGDFGIGVYIENLVRGLLELRARGVADLELTLLVPPYFLEAGAPLPIQQLLAEIDKTVVLAPEPAKKYSFSELFMLARRQRPHLLRADIYHSPHFTLPFFLGVPSVVTIHDVIHVTRPETKWHRLIGGAIIRSAARRADHIISVSSASAELIRQTVRGLRTPITVIPNALQAGIETLPRRKTEEFTASQPYGASYCLFVGNDRPHKGFAELVQAWSTITQRDRIPGGVPVLVAVGQRYGAVAHELVRKLKLEDKVKFAGYVSRETLCHLYNGAQLVVAPSREEGFGLVALEALACSVPVLCSPHASFQEVCGDAAWYTEDYSAEAIARALEQVLSDEVQRRRKVELGEERMRRFTVASTAERACQVYEQVIREARASVSRVKPEDMEPVLLQRNAGVQNIGMVVQQLEETARRKI